MRRFTRGAVVLAVLLMATAALAQPFVLRRMGIVFREGVPHLYFSAEDLLHGTAGEKLEGGLPQRLVITHAAYRTGRADPISVGGRECRVAYDLWQNAYRVQFTPDHGTEHRSTLTSRDAVVDLCLRLRNVPLGRREDYVSGTTMHVRSVIELNPLSRQTVMRIRRWLARPGGGDTVEDNAFFGSFVSLFVGQKIGKAERSLHLQSQTVRVP